MTLGADIAQHPPPRVGLYSFGALPYLSSAVLKARIMTGKRDAQSPLASIRQSALVKSSGDPPIVAIKVSKMVSNARMYVPHAALICTAILLLQSQSVDALRCLFRGQANFKMHWIFSSFVCNS